MALGTGKRQMEEGSGTRCFTEPGSGWDWNICCLVLAKYLKVWGRDQAEILAA
jgi:hypothetical protein